LRFSLSLYISRALELRVLPNLCVPIINAAAKKAASDYSVDYGNIAAAELACHAVSNTNRLSVLQLRSSVATVPWRSKATVP
jgi:hypothetical protein